MIGLRPDHDWWRGKGREWEFCVRCRAPYRLEDLEYFSLANVHYCHWHAKRLAA